MVHHLNVVLIPYKSLKEGEDKKSFPSFFIYDI